MRFEDPFVWRHPGAVIAAAFLTALTATTVLEVLERSSTVEPSPSFNPSSTKASSVLDDFGLPQGTAPTSSDDSFEKRIADEFIKIMKDGRSDVIRAGVLVENALQDMDALLTATEKTLDAAEREVNRLDRVHERETPVDEPNGGAPNNALNKEDRLHSGFLQSFSAIHFCEKYIASRLDVKSVSHHEKRAWRQRIMGVLHQADTYALGGLAGQQERVEYLEERTIAVLSRWGRHFAKPNAQREADASTSHVLTLEEVGYEPIYRSLFAADAKGPSNEEEGARLHTLYNVQPPAKG